MGNQKKDNILYNSTRGLEKGVSATYAIKKGLADDGGLFVPGQIPQVGVGEMNSMINMSYIDRAVLIMRKYLTDFTDEEICQCVNAAYGCGKFDHEAIAPVVKVNDRLSVLELWHGPTSAFKDMALQILPYLLTCSVRKCKEEDDILILTATSGDTGKAALAGFKDVGGTHIIVFYPADGVSEVQKLQMTTQEGDNLSVFGVLGNFDDTQTGVKDIFNNQRFKDSLGAQGIKLSSANSINWGRLLPQIVYYFSAYADLVRENAVTAGNKINIVVPTGNFGNIIAGYYAKMMGLPIAKFICASNSNNILTDFIDTGVYDINREFVTTNSPSMDILISGNLERLLYILSGCDSGKIVEWMEQLKKNRSYEIDKDIHADLKECFYGNWADDEETISIVREIFEKYGYLPDTHTAVAFSVYEKYIAETGDDTYTIVVSTASPYKFCDSVYRALFGNSTAEKEDPFYMMDEIKRKTGMPVPRALYGLRDMPVKFEENCKIKNMPDMINGYINRMAENSED